MIKLDAGRTGRDASKVADEVLAHLVGLMGAEVTVTLDISARIPDGVPDNVVRTVTENCRTLKFEEQGFESEWTLRGAWDHTGNRMICTKSVDDPIAQRDGLRLFVTRYSPRSHSRDECDQWIPSLAPSERLLKQIRNEEITWAQFCSAYRKEITKGYDDESELNPRMRNSGQKHFLKLLRRLGQTRTITLICTCGPDEEWLCLR